MTANLAPDPEHILEAYADATRIVASDQLIRRFQASVVEERARSASRPWSGALAPLSGARLRLRDSLDVAFAPHVAFALRLQALALVLLTILALGALVGGAGAVVVQVVNGPDRGAALPARVLAADSSQPAPGPVATPAPLERPTSPLPAPSPTVAPEVTVRVLAQEVPRRARDAKRPKSVHQPAVAARGCPVSVITRSDQAVATTQRSWSRERSCAS